ncbi:unnamed protein product [Aureobasidium uvarum]|uniref:WKF domain-containing protein n=1 Tax=Aureobasidium uvarum TaxID=2773716 RepID=A0A9N8PV97_9PEZI|nr:unnamed protein product [Aureobasidium uvarum]
MSEQRVPAWKRLGLSLTNAKDTAPLPASPAASTKRSRDDADTPKGFKKQRLDQSQNGANVSSPAQKQSHTSSVASISSPMPSRLRASPEKSILATPNSKHGQRKSVVFSNDTKKQDGDSAQTYFQAWANDELDYYAQKAAAYDAAEAAKAAANNKIEEPAKAVSTQPEIVPEADLTPQKAKKEDKSVAKEEKKKTKKEKKEDQAAAAGEGTTNKDATTQPTSDSATPAIKKPKVRTPKDNANKPVPEYVRYLEQYHADRPAWKFNKSKQNDLLKNIWNIYRIPPSCNEALVEYLDGLQGAAARQRLRQAAQSANIDIVSFIRSEIPEVKDEPMETAEARKAAYDSALERQKEILRKNGIDPDPEKTKTIREQRDYDERVQLVWNTMSKGEPQSVTRAAAPVPKEEAKVDTARSMRKKRKSRTDVSSSESSSESESDSDSDSDSSDSDSDDEKPAAKKAKIAKLEAQLADAKIAKLKAKLAKAKATKSKAKKVKKSKAGSDSSDSDSDSSSDNDSESGSGSDSSSSSEDSSSDSDSD